MLFNFLKKIIKSCPVESSKKAKYIIGTGWWCDGSGKHVGSMQRHNQSWDFIRQKEFFPIWYYFINKYTAPEKIIITDSNSPVKPDLPNDTRFEFVSLVKNFGHFNEAVKDKIMCGAVRAILNGAFYAYLNDVDYYIYIEQDCLVRGEGWVDVCINAMKKGKIMYGEGKGTPQPQQQSLLIIKSDFIPEFINKYLKDWNRVLKIINGEKDFNRFSPENRFHLLFNKQADLLPFGYGRARPINFDNKYLYAQGWTEEELKRILIKEGISYLLGK